MVAHRWIQSSPRRGLLGDRLSRHGTGPILSFSALLFATAIALAASGAALGNLPLLICAALPVVLWIYLLSFFRNPRRRVPAGPDSVVSAADGRVIAVTPLDEEEYIGGPALRVSVFLSIFNVHVNRAPVAGVIEYLRYRPGTFRNALDPNARDTNECLTLGIRMPDGTRVVVRQIAGLIARRIVCALDEGDEVDKGHDYGMIRFGSQTDVSVEVTDARPIRALVEPGQKVRGGETILGEW